jgi:hypothetical protein
MYKNGKLLQLCKRDNANTNISSKYTGISLVNNTSTELYSSIVGRTVSSEANDFAKYNSALGYTISGTDIYNDVAAVTIFESIASGNVNVSNYNHIKAVLVGGGGGGGGGCYSGGDNAGAGGIGGNAGIINSTSSLIDITDSNSITINIGAGGKGGDSVNTNPYNGNNGGTGGSTNIVKNNTNNTIILTANGGTGGIKGVLLTGNDYTTPLKGTGVQRNDTNKPSGVHIYYLNGPGRGGDGGNGTNRGRGVGGYNTVQNGSDGASGYAKVWGFTI